MRLIIAMICLTLGLNTAGQSVPIEIASKVARNFFTECEQNLDPDQVTRELEFLKKEEHEGIPLYYVFDSNKDGGFIVVSGNYNFYPVLGFSLDGKFEAGNLPPALLDLLTSYEDSVVKETLIKSGKESVYMEIWNKYSIPPSRSLRPVVRRYPFSVH